MEKENIEKQIGIRIRSMMKNSKKYRTQKELAEKLDISQPYISQVLNGKRSISLKLLVSICLLYGKVPVITFE